MLPTNRAFAVFLFLVFASAAAMAATDACSLVTTAQVSSALNTTIRDAESGAGGHVCKWRAAKRSSVLGATLRVDEHASGAPTGTQGGADSAGVGGGNGSYWVESGNDVFLFVKKGKTLFKVAVLGKVSVDKKKEMERALARDVAAKL